MVFKSEIIFCQKWLFGQNWLFRAKSAFQPELAFWPEMAFRTNFFWGGRNVFLAEIAVQQKMLLGQKYFCQV
jgi:hypothetical protein